MNPKSVRFSVWYILIGLWALILLQTWIFPALRPVSMAYTEFRQAVAAGKVAEAAVSERLIQGRMRPAEGAKDGVAFTVVRVDDPDLLHLLEEHQVRVSGVVDSTFLRDLLSWVVPALIFVGLWALLLRRFGQSQGSFMTVGRSKAKIYMEREVKVTFADVAGVDEAKEELQEVIEFLKTPERFARLGGKIPKGILLVGPPGTGKTLLARAVAGESGAPFFSISGSEFVEMFVGVGAARVRDLFLQAKEKAPCIVFIDELDALGKARGIGPMAHEEREQTLNQLLVEMDGFDPHAGVILVAATNRPEILDPALLRAGRFDRHVLVDRPDKIGRRAILAIHARGVTLGPDVDLDVIAGMTPGFVGADLANLVNEGALLAVRRGKDAVSQAELLEAVERVIAGLEKRNRILTPQEKERVAHHEVGHALLALVLPGVDKVQKVSVIPRGIAALGYTLQLPTEDRFLLTRTELENKIAVLLGGRVAEEIIYHEVSTGAQNDLLKATAIARSMVKTYGMSTTLGPLSFDRDAPAALWAAPTPPATGDYSEETAREIDREVRRIIDDQVARARRLLDSRQRPLRDGAALLLQRETISGDELRTILDAAPVAETASADAARG